MNKVILIAPNPSQYHAPIYRYISECNVNFEVFFLKKNPISTRFSQGRKISIGVNMEDGYDSTDYSEVKYKTLKIIRDVWKSPPDKLVITGYNNRIFYLSPIFRLLGIDLYWRGEVYHPFSGLKGALKKQLLKQYFKFYKSLIISTKRATKIMQPIVTEGKIEYFPCCVDDKFFFSRFNSKISDKSRIKKSLGLSAKWVINATCRLSDEKNIFQMLEIMALLKSESIQLVLVGDGPLKKKFEELVIYKKLNNVKFAGFRDQEEICDFYIASDFSINISFWDYSPKSMSESLHFGLVPIYNEKIGTFEEIRLVDEGIYLNSSLSNAECATEIISYISNKKISRYDLAVKSTQYTPSNISRTSLI